MRSFPGASSRRAPVRPLIPRPPRPLVLVLALALLLPSGSLAFTAYADETDRLRDKKDKVEQKVENAEKDAAESSRKVAKAVAALSASQRRLGGARSTLEQARLELKQARAQDRRMQERLSRAESRLTQAQVDVVAGQAALAEQRAVVKDLVVTLYQQGDPTLVGLSAYFGASSPSDLIREDQYAQDATAKQSGVFDELAAAEVMLQVRENQVEAARDEVAQRRAEAAAHLEQRAALKERTLAAKTQVKSIVAANKVASARARKARQQDLKILRDLRREEARVRKQLMAAIAAAAASAGGYSGNSDGYLDYPVAGRVTSPYGYRVHPIYGYYGLHDGVDFGAGCGAPLRAVAGGTVINAYYSSVYGYRLYVNLGRVNGRNLIAVYNHASSYRVRVGQRVSRGETVGYVGSTGWSTGCHLHFTVLRDGDPVDPMVYL